MMTQPVVAVTLLTFEHDVAHNNSRLKSIYILQKSEITYIIMTCSDEWSLIVV